MNDDVTRDAATRVRQAGPHVLDLGGRRVHLQVTPGDGPPVVLLGGCGVPSFAFRTVVERLAGHWVVGLDRPGLVETAWPRELPTLAEEVDTLEALGAAVAEPAVVVAHSMAGPHAEAFVRLHPDRVLGLVLLDASVEVDARPPAALVDRAWLAASEVTYASAQVAPFAAVGSLAAAGMIWAQSRRMHLTNARPPRARALFSRPDTLASVVAEQAAYGRQLADLEDLLARTNWPGTPSIVITAGTRAGWVRKQSVLTDRVHGRQVVVEDSKHLIMVDRPDLVADAVLSLISATAGLTTGRPRWGRSGSRCAGVPYARCVAEREGLVAELWYAEAPDLNDPLLLEGFRALAPDLAVQDGSFVVPYAGGELPPPLDAPTTAGQVQHLASMVVPGSSVSSPEKSLPDTTQTWDWPQADAALASARASVLVVERYAGPYGPRDRAAALTSVVAALVAATQPLAISWPTSQRVTDPARPTPDALGGLLNVRLFTVAEEEDERLMDTRGLAPFGLPDVQIHFRDLDPAALAGMLYATGSYVFEAGDVIGDGDTIPGPDGDEHWRCQHEDALVGPARTVLDVDPGDPYAAGRRAR